MKTTQYTIRAIPAKLDARLRQQSKISGQSLNAVLIATLEKGAGLNTDATFDDLDWFIGSKTLSASFNDAQDWLDSLPQDM